MIQRAPQFVAELLDELEDIGVNTLTRFNSVEAIFRIRALAELNDTLDTGELIALVAAITSDSILDTEKPLKSPVAFP